MEPQLHVRPNVLPPWPYISWSPDCDPNRPRILGINPWIHDFAAYNFWLRPVGLLSCLDMLRASGASIALLDCLSPTWADSPWPKPKPFGNGRFPKTHLPTPEKLFCSERVFSRYGLDIDMAAGALKQLDPAPDCVMVTCPMTYWYPGAFEAIRLAKSLWPTVPVVLGGIYATLCPGHAEKLSRADLVIQGPLEASSNWNAFWSLLRLPAPSLPDFPAFQLAHDVYSAPDFAPVLGSRGCPFSCRYCASNQLFPNFHQRDEQSLIQDFSHEYSRFVRDFAFFDDALLFKPDTWLIPLLDRCAELPEPVRLHTPNALHVRFLSKELCQKLKAAGLTTIRLGVETADFSTPNHSKITRDEFLNGIALLREAGFPPEQIGTYILYGLPGQSEEELLHTIRTVRALGLTPYLAFYSPIPGTPLFEEALEISPFPLAEEPLFHNHSLWPCVPGGFSWEHRNTLRKAMYSDYAEFV